MTKRETMGFLATAVVAVAIAFGASVVTAPQFVNWVQSVGKENAEETPPLTLEEVSPQIENSTSAQPDEEIPLWPPGSEPWYLKNEKPEDLESAFVAGREFLGEDNPRYNISDGEICQPFRAVQIPCSYNHRSDLSMFLTVHGKGLFPASGGTNTRVQSKEDHLRGWPDDVYIGTAEQNLLLAEAVRRNTRLFASGLTAEEVRNHWQ